MNRMAKLAAAVSLLMALLPCQGALAHAVCGARVFPPTLTMDDPGVNDELSLPTVQYTPIPASLGTPSGSVTSYGFEWDKTITPHFGFAINGDYITQHGAGQNLNGWDDFTLTLKDQFYCNSAHEFMMSAGVVHEFGGSGSAQLLRTGAIDSIGNTAPTLYLGKGLGDLPIGLLRPLAITGELDYAISDQPSPDRNEWDYAASLQYSLPYLNQNVKAIGGPAFLKHLIPIVELVFASPERGPTTGTISPGVFYEADTWQVGAEAVIPANRATSEIQGTGFIFQFHLFLDDLFPNSLGKPLFGG